MTEIIREISFPVLLTLIAGLSTVFGALLVFFTDASNRKFLTISLGFSAGVMIYISFMEIMPTALEYLQEGRGKKSAELIMIMGFLAGMFIFGIIDKLVPEENNPHNVRSDEDIEEVRELEEAEMEAELLAEKEKYTRIDEGDLERVGIMTAFGIAIHNFPEGLVTFMSALVSPELGISIAIAIALHNIPEGIAVAVPIYQSTGSKRKALWVTFLSGFAEPIGGLFGYFVLRPFINGTSMGFVFALVAGIMVFISLDELLPASRDYGEEHLSIYGVVAGMVIMALTMVALG